MGRFLGGWKLPSVEGHEGKELAISPISLCKQIVDISGYLPRRAHDTPDTAGIQRFADYQPLLSNEIEFKPTADTRFKKGQTLYAYFEIFEPLLEKQPSENVHVQIRIVDAKTGKVRVTMRQLTPLLTSRANPR
jgi:hypothetical protein